MAVDLELEKSSSGYQRLDYAQLPIGLSIPFSLSKNPHWQRAKAHTHRWVHGMRLVPHERWEAFAGAGFDELAALVYPHVSEATLALVTDFISTLFVLDDLVDHQASTLGSKLGELDDLRAYLEDAVHRCREGFFRVTPYASDIMAIGNALDDISERLLSVLDESALEVYYSSFSGYLNACVEESLLRRGSRISVRSLEEYEELRIRSAALIPCLEAGLVGEGISVPQVLRDDPSFQRMWRATNLSVSFINDIFSYNKDVSHGHKTNLLIVLQDIEGLTAEEAFFRAKQIHDGIIADYVDAKHELTPNNLVEDRTWRVVTTLLEGWMRGSYEWSLPGKNTRYTECTTIARFA